MRFIADFVGDLQEVEINPLAVLEEGRLPRTRLRHCSPR
jgi:hypothetical protein